MSATTSSTRARRAAADAVRKPLAAISDNGFENSKSRAYKPARPDGCHPVDGCQDGTPFFGSVFQYLAANVVLEDTGNTILPPYEIFKTSKGEQIAFIGETFEGTPLVVTPTGVAGLDFLDEADTVNALVPKLKKKGIEAIVLLLHEGGFQNAPFSMGFLDVNGCENFNGPGLVDVVSRLDPEVDVVVSAHTHAAYVCTIEQPARDERIVVRPADHADRPDDRREHRRHRRGDREEQRGHPDRRQGRAARPRSWPGTSRCPTRSRTA